ncbi:MAG: ATP-binding protein [Desulfobulbaceae bacterium]
MYKRHIEQALVELLDDFRILYLTGPRQAGKTTLVKQLAGRLGMKYVTLDDQAVFAAINNDPHGYIRSQAGQRLILDEFQYAVGLIPAIKEASDALAMGEKGKFLLTGSADIFRSAKTQEALPGHMARVELYPLSLGEIKESTFNLIDFLAAKSVVRKPLSILGRDEIAQLLLSGGFPEVQEKRPRSRQIWFRSYVEGRLFKDFESLYSARGDYHSKLLALVKRLAGLSGNLLKYSNISNELMLDDKLVKSYIEILELMFIVKRLPAYVKNYAKRSVVGMPKVQFVDTGLACHLLGLQSEQALLQSQFYGGLLENYVFMECYKHVSWAIEQVSLYHFRDKHQNEVDLVLEKSDANIIGIEIKASATVREVDFRGLVKLSDYAGRHFEKGVLFYTGSELLPFKFGGKHFYAIPLSVMIS